MMVIVGQIFGLSLMSSLLSLSSLSLLTARFALSFFLLMDSSRIKLKGLSFILMRFPNDLLLRVQGPGLVKIEKW